MSFLNAQEENPAEQDENNPAIESDWSVFDVPSYERGDNMFGIGFGAIFPVLFVGNNGPIENKVNLGGTISLSYDYFFHPNMSVGAEANVSFSSTIGENMLFQIPVGVRFTYQFVLHPIEIPITMAVGMAPQSYLDDNYFGMYLKPSLGVFWRFNADWSFGLQGTWWWMPQWTADPARSVYGNFVTAALTARYHF
ncbi:MAG: hypothetical protein LBV20_06530 [Treponema sp.]|nr:hypothetical protein [Treponema sp.]